jgi:hypothetical protein
MKNRAERSHVPILRRERHSSRFILFQPLSLSLEVGFTAPGALPDLRREVASLG